MTFHVGQKVVCIDTDGLVSPFRLERDKIYTIRALRDDVIRFARCKTYTAVLLAEINTPPKDWGEGIKEPGYSTVRFRPLVTKSIQLFRDIAAGVTNGSPIIDDPQFDDALPTEALCRFMHSFGGRPML